MDEQETITQDKPEEAVADTDIGKPTEQEEQIVKDAKAAAETKLEAEKLKAANLDREEALMKRKEALAALGGGSNAGTGTKPTEPNAAEYAKKAMAGEIDGR